MGRCKNMCHRRKVRPGPYVASTETLGTWYARGHCQAFYDSATMEDRRRFEKFLKKSKNRIASAERIRVVCMHLHAPFSAMMETVVLQQVPEVVPALLDSVSDLLALGTTPVVHV